VPEIAPAVVALERGGVVVAPTDTVYGLAAMPGITGAVHKLFQLKGREENKPIPILAGGTAALAGVVRLDGITKKLGEKFWPGPLTLVVSRAPGFVVDLGAGEGVAVRVPDSAPMLDLLGFSGPLAVTSANRSGQPPATSVDEARATFGGDVDVYLDGGRCSGTPSSVISLLGSDPEVVRAGPISLDEIRAALDS
jgi:L-threonylcarbamoyladenylate synthase